jgi:hypothetical protein
MNMCSHYYETVNKYGVPETRIHITCLGKCVTLCEYYHRLPPDVKHRLVDGLVSGHGNAETVSFKTTERKYEGVMGNTAIDNEGGLSVPMETGVINLFPGHHSRST